MNVRERFLHVRQQQQLEDISTESGQNSTCTKQLSRTFQRALGGGSCVSMCSWPSFPLCAPTPLLPCSRSASTAIRISKDYVNEKRKAIE